MKTRQRILDAAEKLFSAHGYKGVSMRQITVAASVNVAAIQYHFDNKVALFSDVMARRLHPICADIVNEFDILKPRMVGEARLTLKTS